jgi:hypothetical protein
MRDPESVQAPLVFLSRWRTLHRRRHWHRKEENGAGPDAEEWQSDGALKTDGGLVAPMVVRRVQRGDVQVDSGGFGGSVGEDGSCGPRARLAPGRLAEQNC